MSRPGDFIAEKVININLDVEIPLTKKLDSWETSEGGSTETRGYSQRN